MNLFCTLGYMLVDTAFTIGESYPSIMKDTCTTERERERERDDL